MSKGSRQRPQDKAKFDKEFDRIFGKKDEDERKRKLIAPWEPQKEEDVATVNYVYSQIHKPDYREDMAGQVQRQVQQKQGNKHASR